MFSLPVLLIGYNRPDFLRNRLDEIRNIPIRKLYVSIDSLEKGINPEIKKIVNEFEKTKDSMQLEVNLELENQGLTRHVTSAISRVLESEEAVIVIEDDISISNQSYQAFISGYLLLRKMNMTGVVSAFSPLVQPKRYQKNIWRETPYFSVWGWVATRQNWENYTFDMSRIDILEELAKSKTWKKLSTSQRSVWFSRFKRAQFDPLLTWDIQMQYCSFRNDYTNLVPLFRVVENLGFNDSRAAHTKFRKPRWFRNSDPSKAVIPSDKLNATVNIFGNLIDSMTLAGDSRVFQIWTHQLRKKILKAKKSFQK